MLRTKLCKNCFKMYSTSVNYFLLLVVATLCIITSAFNVDTSHVLTFPNNRLPTFSLDSHFGFSVALHRNLDGKYLLVGAPKANSLYSSSARKPGTVYKCRIDGQSNRCDEIPFITSGTGQNNFLNAEYLYDDLWDDSFLGGSLDVAPVEGPYISTCAHLWKNKLYYSEYYANGLCFVINADLSTGSIRKLMPLTRKSKLFSNTDTHRYSYGLAGFSSHFLTDTADLTIGAPGITNWTGSVSHTREFDFSVPYGNRVDNVPFAIPNAEYSYIGYSLSSGHFTSPDEKEIVTGAPRHGVAGAVFVISVPVPQDFTFEKIIKMTLNGTQMGEYFGYSVCAVDLNNDGYSDLLVGAPMYSEEEYDEGKVYVYLNSQEERLIPTNADLYGSKKPRARFGTSISAIGDVNKDNFQDVVIGAPYEDDQGAVYLYHGGINGLRLSQKILASVLTSPIKVKGFGISISRGMDIDDNNFPDFAVGAYDSNQAMVFRTYPVVKIDVRIEFNVSQISMSSLKCSSQGESTVCFTIRVCSSHSGGVSFNNLELTQNITFGTTEHMDKRGFFLDGSVPATRITRDVQFTSDKPSFCHEFVVHVLNSTKDILTPLAFEVVTDIKKDPTKEASFCGNCPVVDPTHSKTIVKRLSFVKNCGDDDVCLAELNVRASFKKISEYFIGSPTPSVLQIFVKNTGEPSYQSKIKVTYPIEVKPTRLIGSCSEEIHADRKELTCDIGNPIGHDEETSLEIPLDMNAVKIGTTQLIYTVNATTTSSENNLDDNHISLTLPVKTDADIAVFGSTDQLTLPKSVNGTRNVTLITHDYQIVKYGHTPVKSATVSIHVPYRFEDELFLEILSIKAVSASSSTIDCSTPGSDGSYKTKSLINQESDNTWVLDCSTAECMSSVCTIKPMPDDQQLISVKVSMRVLLGPLIENIGDREKVKLLTISAATIDDTNIVQPENHRSDIAQASTEFYKEELVASKKIPSWIIPVCILIGIILLALIIYLFKRMGFFKRTRKEEMESLSKEQPDGDDLLQGTQPD